MMCTKNPKRSTWIPTLYAYVLLPFVQIQVCWSYQWKTNYGTTMIYWRKIVLVVDDVKWLAKISRNILAFLCSK